MPEYIEEKLRVDLTEDEVREHADRMATRMEDLELLTDEFNTVKRDYKSRLEIIELEVRQHAQKVRNRWELRPVECEVVRDFKAGVVRIVRTDTGEIAYERRMSNEDRQQNLAVAG